MPATRKPLTPDTRCTGPGPDGGNSCTRTAHSRGLCPTHYSQQREGRPLAVLEPQPRKPDCALSTCSNEGRVRGYCNTHAVTKRKYQLNAEQFETLMSKESCDLCGVSKSQARLSIDHDHAHCGPRRGCAECVRGVLCYACNVTLAHVHKKHWIAKQLTSDELDWLRRAADYTNNMPDSTRLNAPNQV